jgi:hypothetical protein
MIVFTFILRRSLIVAVTCVVAILSASAQITYDTIGSGWAKTSVNTVVFRKNALVTHGDMQYAAFYDADGFVVIAKRERGKKWISQRSQYKGNVADAHNSISIGVDGAGFLHVAWDHHTSKLRYARSASAGSLQLSNELEMTGMSEDEVTYPEFHRLPSGDLLFFYRSGESGEGNLIINRYDRSKRSWTQIQSNLLDGEGDRNAYWQSYVDANGMIHLSWVWRETWDVSTNHDMCYARSRDNGVTWERSDGTKYKLPINQANAEYAFRIPQNSELINQTSMSADAQSHPYIATYWRADSKSLPQYFLIWHNGQRWASMQVSDRKTDFSLRGGGTKKIPISRPQVLADSKGKEVLMIFRDTERGAKVSVAKIDLASKKWSNIDLTSTTVGDWEPTYDSECWKKEGLLNIFVQRTGQGDGEKQVDLEPQPVVILGYRK